VTRGLETAAVVSWRFGRAGEGGLPPLDQAGAWLTPGERRRAVAFRVPKRRDDWLTGRLNLKALVGDALEARFGERPHPASLLVDRLPSGAPLVRQIAAGALEDAASGTGPGPLPLSVSNSHSNGAALAAAVWTDSTDPRSQSPGPTATLPFAVGADLELVEPRSDGFVRDFLTAEERVYCGRASGRERDLRANLVWSAKEAVLKVLQLGLSADTWWLTCLPEETEGRGGARHAPATASESNVARGEVVEFPVEARLDPEPASWRRFTVSCDPRLGAQGVAFTGRWREVDGFVATVAVGARAESAR